MQKEIENALGRKLTKSESSLVNWINQWEKETVEAFQALLSAMWKAGQAHAYHEAMAKETARD